MAGKIKNFLREFQLIFSIILTIIGIILLFLSATGIWYNDIPQDWFGLTEGFFAWCPYLLVIGFIVFGAGVYYLYVFLNNRKFLLEEIKTNKRSEFVKRHGELKTKVKHLPTKYQIMLKDKENELKIK